MTIKAHFDGKAFVPAAPVDLPAGAEVMLTFERNGTQPLRGLLALARRAPIEDAPPDWSEQHDHYIHGTPKR